jgi:hypothetical protein
MGKKLFSTRKWKEYLKQRQEYEIQKRNRRNKRGGRAGRPSLAREIAAKNARRRFHLLRAPTEFSIIQNAPGVIAFLTALEYYSQQSNVTIDLSEVTLITTDAVAALVATLKRIPGGFRGNLPQDSLAQEILIQSGFFHHVKSVQPLPQVLQGLITQEQSKKVQPDLAAHLIHVGTARIHGSKRPCQPAYRVLIESMNNTHNHAAKEQHGEQTWWATVYADVQRKTVCYTFVDTGVGIFRSVRLKGIRKIYRGVTRLVGVKTDANILRDMLQGKIESSTGVSYRGKGLPAIYRHAEAGRIKSLVIIANGVYANVSKDEYINLDTEFRGTLLYWET